MIQYYYGDGKGKTTAAVGSAIRMAGNGGKVLFAQFYKNGDSSEVKILKSLDNIEYKMSLVKYSLFEDDKGTLDKINQEYLLLIQEIKEEIKSDNISMVVLDEIQYLYETTIDKEDFNKWIKEISTDVEVILTGHSLSEELINISDYVSEIKKIKHPFDKGIDARKGIEY